ncbi:MAG: hypothetical protein ABJF67_17690 [Aurantimonas coralicida]
MTSNRWTETLIEKIDQAQDVARHVSSNPYSESVRRHLAAAAEAAQAADECEFVNNSFRNVYRALESIEGRLKDIEASAAKKTA